MTKMRRSSLLLVAMVALVACVCVAGASIRDRRMAINHPHHQTTTSHHAAGAGGIHQHSFVSAASHAKTKAKGGDQWWLQKAPWFLPSPPEWGPMPVTMYTSYYHKPTFPHHLDYAHGIPLPHAEALNLARRTYPQPPFEVQAAGGDDSSFMEVAETAEQETEGDVEAEADEAAQVAAELEADDSAETELDEAAEAEIEDQAETEVDTEGETDAELVEVESEAEADSETETEHQTEAAATASATTKVERDLHPNFYLDEGADKLGAKSEAVEAVEVDDLTQASPLPDEELFSRPM